MSQVVKELQNQSSPLLKNTLWMVWSGSVNIASSVLLWVMMAHWREAEELGRFTVVMSIYLIFMTICSLGLGPYLTNETSRRIRYDHSPWVFVASAVAFLFSWSVLCACAMCVTGYLMGDSPEVWRATAIMSSAIVLTGLISVAESAFTACERVKVIALATTGENLLRTVLPLLLLYRRAGLVWICLSYAAMRAIACAIYAVAARHHLPTLTAVKWHLMREIASKSPTFAGVAILAAIHWQAAPLLVGKISGEAAAADYGVASRFLLPLVILLPSYAAVIQPVAARLAAVSLKRLGAFLSDSLMIATALTLPFAVGATLLARELLGIIFGEGYIGAAPVLALLAMSLVPFGWVIIIVRGLVATGHQRIDLAGNVVAVASCLVLNLVLVPPYQATGAAAAQLISMLLLAAVDLGYANYRLFRLNVWQVITACCWPLAVMTFTVWQARDWGLWGAVVAGGLVYLGCLWLAQGEKLARVWRFESGG